MKGSHKDQLIVIPYLLKIDEFHYNLMEITEEPPHLEQGYAPALPTLVDWYSTKQTMLTSLN